MRDATERYCESPCGSTEPTHCQSAVTAWVNESVDVLRRFCLSVFLYLYNSHVDCIAAAAQVDTLKFCVGGVVGRALVG